MIAQTISHYKILEKLGGGGMGVVYRAEDTKLKRTVALKFLPPDLTRDEEAKVRFIHEAQAASALDHNNICNIHEIGETDDGQMFIAMACYEGETLKKKIERGPLKIDEALDYAIQIAQGLAKAHEKGIVHRDIKPANVLITIDSVAKIVDFGLAKLAGGTKLTKAGSTLGTAAYMSPEQARGENVDARTDIWSFGVLMYEMITGQQPFKGEYANAVLYSILSSEPEPVTALRTGVPMELERIVNKCLEKGPAERYQHSDDLLADLRSMRKRVETGEVPRAAGAVKRLTGRPWYVYAGITVIVVAVILAVIYYFVLPTSEVFDSVAVLPAENLSGDASQEPFTDGMTVALISELEKVKGLTPMAWQSVKRYKNTDKSVVEIARELGVKAIVSTQCLRERENVRISVSLIPASSQKPVWTKTFDRDLTNVLVLQSEVARAIVNEINVTVTQEEQERLSSSYQVDPQAYEAYLKGKFFQEKFGESDLKKALEYFNLAIAKDSNYALPYVGLSNTYFAYLTQGWASSMEVQPRIQAAIASAVEKDSNLAEAHGVVARKKLVLDWDVEGALKECRKALDLNPGSSLAHLFYSSCLEQQGRFNEAIAENKRAQELDPLSLEIKLRLGLTYWKMRQYDKSIATNGEILEMDSSYIMARWNRAVSYLDQSRFQEAYEEFKRYESLIPGDIYNKHGFALVYALTGQREKARALLRELEEYSKSHYFSWSHRAILYALLGDKNKAIEYLERASRERDIFFLDVAIEPLFDSLRSDPRFTALLRKTGLEK